MEYQIEHQNIFQTFSKCQIECQTVTKKMSRIVRIHAIVIQGGDHPIGLVETHEKSTSYQGGPPDLEAFLLHFRCLLIPSVTECEDLEHLLI